MGAIGTKLRRATWPGGTKLHHWCPACEEVHGYIIEGGPPSWTFDGNYEKPTFLPSMRIYITRRDGTEQTLCHYFIKAGRIEFCGDNPHALNGQTVDLPDWPYARGAYGGIED
jgi:hypothetical protein